MKSTIVNIFGTLGYASVLLQWAWSLLILTYPLITSDEIQKKFFSEPSAPKIKIAPEIHADFAPLIATVSLIITVIVIFFTIVALIKMPKKVGKTGAKITHSAANIIVANTQKQPQQKAEKWRITLSYKSIILIKFILTFLPPILLLFAPKISQMPQSIIAAVGNFCLAFSVFYWIMQYALAKIYKISPKKIW